MLAGTLHRLALIVEGDAGTTRYLQHVCQFVMPRQSEDHARFVGATDLLACIKECNFLNCATSARNRMKAVVHDGIGVWSAARRLNFGRFV